MMWHHEPDSQSAQSGQTDRQRDMDFSLIDMDVGIYRILTPIPVSTWVAVDRCWPCYHCNYLADRMLICCPLHPYQLPWVLVAHGDFLGTSVTWAQSLDWTQSTLDYLVLALLKWKCKNYRHTICTRIVMDMFQEPICTCTDHRATGLN